MTGEKSPLSLYIHIPFCTRKCDYCHFYVLPNQIRYHEQLMVALKKEWDSWLPKIEKSEIVTLYFGGGTPALLGPKNIAKIISWVDPSANIEITLEANPENITRPMMSAFRNAGINRVSIGIQSLDDALLSTLTRTHNKNRAIEAIHETYDAGISNISIDLMYDLPGQTLDTWSVTLHQAASLPITHLSLYNLTFEPHTAFYKKRETLLKTVPEGSESLLMYKMAADVLTQNQFKQYEISAFERGGHRSEHNSGYWLGREFIGLGPSAFSYLEGQRFRNIANLNKYAHSLEIGESPVDYREELSKQERMRELFAVNLRLLDGCPIPSIDEETTKSIERMCAEGLLEVFDHHVKLTDQGILFYDTVAAEII